MRVEVIMESKGDYVILEHHLVRKCVYAAFTDLELVSDIEPQISVVSGIAAEGVIFNN